MIKANAIVEVADCLEKNHMRHFFDKRRKLIILSISDDELVDFICKELERIEEDDNYVEVPTLSQHELHTLMQKFIDSIKDNMLKSELYNQIITNCMSFEFTDFLEKYPKTQQAWIEFKKEHFEKLAEAWLQKQSLL